MWNLVNSKYILQTIVGSVYIALISKNICFNNHELFRNKVYIRDTSQVSKYAQEQGNYPQDNCPPG